MIGINEPQKTVFVDESGNNGFDFSQPGVSTHYIISAIIINTENVATIREQAEKIRRDYFKDINEMKSIYCKDHGRRFKIVSEIAKLDLIIVSIVIDKRKIYDNSNIKQYKKTFYKYLNKLLYTELKIFNTDMAIFADEYGDKDFMESFKQYIDPLFPWTLINNNSFEFIDSKSEPLIQVADFIAGTLSYGYEESRKSINYYKGYFALLRNKMIPIKEWPPPDIIGSLSLIDHKKYNKIIAKNCLGIASDYINKYQMSDNEQIIDQILILKLFRDEIYFNNPNKYFYINYLIDYLFERTGRKYERQLFQAQIIAALRDEGVIISSSSGGLKIPVTSKELNSYTHRVLGQAIPMLDRLENARNRILAITNNELDIVGEEQYKRIRDYMTKSS